MMTTQDVANRYCELANQNLWEKILNELCDSDLVNMEPEHVRTRGIEPVTRGLENILAKGAANREKIENIFHQSCSSALVAGNFFTVQLSRDVQFKDGRRMNLEELGVFALKDGKIISEQFFY